MNLLPGFIQAIHKGIIEGLSIHPKTFIDDGYRTCIFHNDTCLAYEIERTWFEYYPQHSKIVLMELIRSWITSRGWSWQLTDSDLLIWPHNRKDLGRVITSNTIDAHQQALLHILSEERNEPVVFYPAMMPRNASNACAAT